MAKKKRRLHRNQEAVGTRVKEKIEMRAQTQVFERILKLGCFYFLLLLPFVRLKSFYGIESPKFFFSLLVILTLSAVALIGLARGYLTWPKTKWNLLVVFYLLAWVISTLASVDPLMSLLGMYPHFNSGLVANFLGIIFFFLILLGQPKKEEAIQALKVIVSLTAFLGLFGIAEYFRVFNIGDPNAVAAHRSIGYLLNPDITLSYLLFLFPVNLYFFWRERENWRYFFALNSIIQVINLFLLLPAELQRAISHLLLSGRGIAALLFLICLIIISWLESGVIAKFLKQNRKKLAILASIATVLVGILVTVNFSEIKNNFNSFLTSPANAERFWGWQAGWDHGKNHWLIGTGPATITYYLSEIRQKIPFDGWNDNTTTANVHNQSLDYFAMMGVLGLLSYWLLWGGSFFVLIRGIKKNVEERSLLIAFFVSMLLSFVYNQFVFSFIASMFLPWLIFALSLLVTGEIRYINKPSALLPQWQRALAPVSLIASTLLIIIVFAFMIADYSFSVGAKNGCEVDRFKQATAWFPWDDVYWVHLGMCNYFNNIVIREKVNKETVNQAEKEKIIKESTLALEKAIELRPKNTKAWLNYGIALLGMKSYDSEAENKAKAAFDQALKIDPLSELSRVQISNGYGFVDDLEKTDYYLNEALSLSHVKSKAQIYIALGKLYVRKGDKEKALETFREAKKYPTYNPSDDKELDYFIKALEEEALKS